MATQQIERLNKILRERNAELNETQSKLQEFEFKMTRTDGDVR